MNKLHRGFTLIELLSVVSIIAIIVGMLITGAAVARKKAKLSKAKAETNELARAWKTYWTVYGKWASSLGVATTAGTVTPVDMTSAEIAILMGGAGSGGGVDNPQNIIFIEVSTNASGAFLDPWGKEYKVEFTCSPAMGGATCETVVSLPNRRRYENE